MFKQKILSKDFIIKIIEKAAGRIPQIQLENFLSCIEKEINLHYFTKSSESNLLRIIQNQFDFTFFANECLKYPHQIEILISLSNNSNYLTDILVRNPEYFHWIINPSVLSQNIDDKYFINNLGSIISSYKSFDAKINAIRNFKRKEILRIGLKDIYLKEDLIKVTIYLSQLAKSISKVLFELCYKEVLTKYGIEKSNRKYTIFSLGKLGGNELNYSSDIDLVAFYDKNSFINKKAYYDQILSESVLLFIEIASKKTGYGFLYRVDFRLRPDGRNAPLCGSYLEYLHYYEMRGEDWERQMLIKASYLCGSKSLYNKFSDYISRFIYPKSFSASPIEQIKRMKLNIEKRNKSEENIKLVSGGIRDIEFSLQALQLLNGGKDITIRCANTIATIKKLQNKKIITENEAITFSNAYTFYRKAEHYLQLMNDQQTHTIPSEGEIAEKLAHFLGFKSLKSFKDKINFYRSSVQNIYNSIINSDIPKEEKKERSQICFVDVNRANKNLEFLRTGKSLFNKKQFDKRTTSTFENIEDQLNEFLTTSIDADLVLENFARVIRTAQFPKIWFDEFADNKFFLLFLRICENSQKTIDIFAEDRRLRDNFLARENLIPFSIESSINIDLKTFYFRSSVQLTANILSQQDFSKYYTEYLNNQFAAIINDFIKDKDWQNSFFIAAMGSFGSAELSFSSDVDLVFVVQEIDRYPNIQKEFQLLLNTLKNHFVGLDIDCRLRPEGKSSQLVWDIDDYVKYFDNRVRVWELQAFSKCRLLIGNKYLFDNFIDLYIRTIGRKDKKQIKSEMIDMRKRLLPIGIQTFNIKKSIGGLLDIDFIKSYLLLTNPNLITHQKGGSIFKSIATLKNNLIKDVNFDLLEQNFLFLKSIELINQNIFNVKGSKIPTEENKILKLSSALQFDNPKKFTLKLNDSIKQIKNEYYKLFKN